MQKKKIIPISPKTSIGFKCGECLHFSRLAKFEKPCSFLGIKAFANAPSCFTPDVFKLQKTNPDIIYQIGNIMKDFTSAQARVLIALLRSTRAQEKFYNLKFGQPVYFCLSNNYLSNYFIGFVVGVASQGEEQVYVSSNLGKKQRSSPMLGSFIRDRVLTISEFKKRKKDLIAQGKIQDPKKLFTPSELVKAKPEDYEIPNMETAPKDWLDKLDTAKIKKRPKRELDGTLSFKL
jgi:hypothetical protein